MFKPILISSLVLFSGCSVKEYKLFQQKKIESLSQVEDRQNIQDINISYSSKIVPNDIIKIDIYNMNQKSNIMMQDAKYNNPSSQQEDNTYIVYEDGSIILPLLNEVNVQGFTIKELNINLTDRYREFLKSPYVKATIKNHKVFVLGEVNKRGVVAIEGETISVIEAIAKSGGLTDQALRNRIRIISEDNGKYTLRTLNLNNFKTLNSRNLLLTHNSILYIEPKSTKAIRVAINDYLPIIQAASSILSTFLTIEILKDK
jgi:polysaccharide export outer membrane protein